MKKFIFILLSSCFFMKANAQCIYHWETTPFGEDTTCNEQSMATPNEVPGNCEHFLGSNFLIQSSGKL